MRQRRSKRVESRVGAAEPFHGGLVQAEARTALDTDMHQSFEAGIILSGQQERHFEDLVVVMGPGDVCLHPPWEPHGWRILEAGTSLLSLNFAPEFLGEEAFEGMSWLTLFASPPSERPQVTAEAMRERVLRIGDELAREIVQKEWGWLSAVRLGILQLLLTLSRGWQPKGGAAEQRLVHMSNLAKIMPAISLLHSQHPRRVTRKEAAAACGLSVSHFAVVFNQTMRMGFGRFAMRHRLASAARLLLSTSLSVEDIAGETGFVDGSHLHRSFTSFYGCTPLEYRQQAQRGRKAG